MSVLEFLGLGPNGELTVRKTESFVTQSIGYSLQLAARWPDKYHVLVIYFMEHGTTKALREAGAPSPAAIDVQARGP